MRNKSTIFIFFRIGLCYERSMAIFFTTGAQPPPRRIGAGGCQWRVSERLDVVDTDRSSLGLDAPGELERSIGHDDLGHDLLGLRGIEHRDGVHANLPLRPPQGDSTSLPLSSFVVYDVWIAWYETLSQENVMPATTTSLAGTQVQSRTPSASRPRLTALDFGPGALTRLT
jgi:hypothetical protein